jgi:3-(3-hydroxy-phenyl)propionate hydroxylase
MADGVWRLDYQMPEDCDTTYISQPEVAGARLREQLGPGVEFEFVWIGPYGYKDHLLDHFRHDRVFFIGDAAHVVSPFGARGGNSGIQDAANLGWKLALVLRGSANEALLDSYDAERRAAAAENLRVTRRSARFLAPRSPIEHLLRRAVLTMAARHPFARSLIDTGRMSVANAYPSAPDLPHGAHSVPNIPLRWADGSATSLMQLLEPGSDCLGLWFAPTRAQAGPTIGWGAHLPLKLVAVGGDSGLATLQADEALWHMLGDPRPGSLCLIRPDAYQAASIETVTPESLERALRSALAVG